MFTYDKLKEDERERKGQNHCASAGPVHELSTLIRGGSIRSPGDGRRRLTAGRSVKAPEGVLIYAVDENFRIHVGFDSQRGTANAVKHETLFHNADVLAAGELEVEGGIIVGVTDMSGTYGTVGRLQTDPAFRRSVLTALDRTGAPLAERERERLLGKAGR